MELQQLQQQQQLQQLQQQEQQQQQQEEEEDEEEEEEERIMVKEVGLAIVVLLCPMILHGRHNNKQSVTDLLKKVVGQN